MSSKNKLPNDAKQYGELGAEGSKNWRKYKATGKEKYKDRATKAYDTQKALGIKMSNPGTNINNTNVNIKDSFTKTTSKTTNVSGNSLTIASNNKKIVPKLKKPKK